MESSPKRPRVAPAAPLLLLPSPPDLFDLLSQLLLDHLAVVVMDYMKRPAEGDNMWVGGSRTELRSIAAAGEGSVLILKWNLWLSGGGCHYLELHRDGKAMVRSIRLQETGDPTNLVVCGDRFYCVHSGHVHVIHHRDGKLESQQDMPIGHENVISVSHHTKLAADASNHKLYLCSSRHSVLELDLQARKASMFAIGTFAQHSPRISEDLIGLTCDTQGALYLVNLYHGYVCVYDCATHALLREFSIPYLLESTLGGCLALGDKLYITGRSSVEVVSAINGKWLGSLKHDMNTEASLLSYKDSEMWVGSRSHQRVKLFV